VQIHTLQKEKPPIHIICPGRVYRKDYDVTHTPMFHQVEGLVVDSENISISNLKWLITGFLQSFFAKEVKVRFRPSYFPFTEPSFEVDIGCVFCKSKGCRVCSHTTWIEVLGAGMVHPNVLSNVGLDSNVYKGIAFGLGVERLTMLYYGINDLRTLYENNLSFLNSFKGCK
jgi:phenylalanyl-tRNA synthetase alpha chain